MEIHPLLPEDLTRLRPFVRALVADDASTDDILQETWLRSRRSLNQNQGPSAALAWARRTAERLVWSRSRSERSRAAREQHAAAAREHAPDPQEQLGRIELLRHVLGKLAELPEQDRQALTLRYLGDESARSIAAQLGVSEDAARQRVHRAMKRLRAELDAEHDGARATWAGPLVGLVGTVGTTSQVLPLAKLGVAAGLLASVGIGLALAADPAEPSTEQQVAGAPIALELTESPADASQPPSSTANRQAVDSRLELAPAGAVPTPLASTGSFEVTLLEAPHDKPLADVEVWWLASAVNPIRGSARTDDEGRLRLPFYPGSHWHVGLALQPEGHALHSPSWQGHDRLARLLEEPVLRFAPGILLGGALSDPAGRAVRGARVHLTQRPGYGYHGEWWPEDLGWWAPTLEDGSFSIWAHDLKVDLEIYHPGYGLLELYSDDEPATFEALGRNEAELVMDKAPAYRGRVTDSAGKPLSGADVTLIRHLSASRLLATRTDDKGRFRLAEFNTGWFETAAVTPMLVVRKPGFRGVAIRAESGQVLDTIALTAAPALLVRVANASGSPLVGAKIELREAGFNPTKEEPYSELQPRITGADGMARYDSVLEGPFKLVVSADGFDYAFRTMDAIPREPTEIRLVPYSFIDVRLTAPGETEPVAPDSVILDYIKDGEPRSYRPYIVPYGQGFSRVAQIRASLGEYTVRLRVEGFKTIELGPLTPEQGSQRFKRTLQPEQPKLEGLLLDHNGEPLADVPIAALEGPFERLREYRPLQLDLHRHGTRTGPDGSFQISDPGPSAVFLAQPRTGVAFSTIAEFQRNGSVIRSRPMTTAYLGRLPYEDSKRLSPMPRPSEWISNPELRFAFVITSPGFEQPDARMIFPGQRQPAGGGILFAAAPCGPSELVWGVLDKSRSPRNPVASSLGLVDPLGPPSPIYMTSPPPDDALLDSTPIGGPSGSRRFDFADGERPQLTWRE